MNADKEPERPATKFIAKKTNLGMASHSRVSRISWLRFWTFHAQDASAAFRVISVIRMPFP